MPKKQEGYEDAIGSIFDFIFANNKKSKKGKGFVYKPSGFSGTDEMTRALAEIASKPYTYMSDAALNHLNETILDQGLIEVYLDQKDGKKYRENYDPKASRYRLRLSDVGKAMSDPRGFVDKIDKKMKQQRGWIALTGASAILDSAVAVGIGKKQGMTTKEALAFGKAARVEYDPQMLEMQKELTASSAASNAMFDRAKSKAVSEGLDPKTEAYQRRVFELVKGSKTAIKEDSRLLYEAMRSSGTARKARYFTSMSKDGSDLAPAVQEVESYLKKKVGYSTPEEKERVDTLLAQFQDEVKYSRSHGGATISGYRMAYARNQGLRAQFASTQQELENAVKAQNLTYAWERIKGGSEYADIDGSIESLSEEIRYYNGLAGSDPRYKPLVKDLERHMGQLNKIKGKSLNSLRGLKEYQGYWASPNTAFAPRAQKKIVVEANREIINSDITRLQFLMDNADNEADKKRFEIQMRAAQQSYDAIGLVPGAEIRNRVDSYISTYSVFTQGILQGGIGAGLIDGTSYHNKGAAGMFAPGVITNTKFYNKGGYVMVGNGYYEVNGERLRFANGLLVSEKGKSFSLVGGKLIGSDGKEVTDKYGNVYKLNEKDIEQGYFRGGMVLPRDEINMHYARLAGMYYLTPTSMLKTALWNGEGFSYLGAMNQFAIQRAFNLDRRDILSSFINSNKGLFSGVSDLFDPQSGDINKAVLSEKYLEILEILNNNNTILPEGLQKILKVANRKYKIGLRYTKMGDFISKNIADKWSGFFKGLKDGMAAKLTSFFQKFTKDAFVKDQIEKFFNGKLGLRQIVSEGIKSALLALANAIGFATTGGLANIALTAVTWLATDAIMSLTKPLFAILLVCLWGVCGVIGFAFSSMSFLSPSNVAHANMPPIDVEQCGVELYPSGEPWQHPDLGYGDPPHDGICPFSSTAACTQGPNGGFSHAQMGTLAIDIAGNAGIWRAPSNGTVTVAIDNVDCGWDSGKSSGGKIIFVDEEGNEYRLLHVVPLVGTGSVSQGEAIARLATNLPVSSCWTGPHYHLDVKANGGWVNAEDWYSDLGCNISCP